MIRRGYGELDRTITVDPIVVNGQDVGAAPVITGQTPPAASWWPWIVAAGALALAWWFSNEDDDEEDLYDDEEGRDIRPLAA